MSLILTPHAFGSSPWDTSRTSGAHTKNGAYLSGTGSGRSFSLVGKNAGKAYAEIYINDGVLTAYNGEPMVGFTSDNSSGNCQQLYYMGNTTFLGLDSGTNGRRVYKGYDNTFTVGASVALAATSTMMLAMDIDAGKVWFGKGGTWEGDPASGTGEAGTLTASLTYYLFCYHGNSSAFSNYELRVSVASFAHSLPSGFSAWV